MSAEIDYNRLQMAGVLRNRQDLKPHLRRWLEVGMHTSTQDYPGIPTSAHAQTYRALPENPNARGMAVDTLAQALAGIIIEEIHPRTADSRPDYLLVSTLCFAALLKCPKHLEKPLKGIPDHVIPDFEDWDRSNGVDYREYLNMAIEANTQPVSK